MAPGHGNGGEGVERGEGAMRSALAHVKDSYPAFEGEGLIFRWHDLETHRQGMIVPE